jgi:hypothetical protein
VAYLAKNRNQNLVLFLPPTHVSTDEVGSFQKKKKTAEVGPGG